MRAPKMRPLAERHILTFPPTGFVVCGLKVSCHREPTILGVGSAAVGATVELVKTGGLGSLATTSPAGGYSSKHYEAPPVAMSKPKRDGAGLRATLDALLTQAVTAGVTDSHGVDAVYRNLSKGRFDEV